MIHRSHALNKHTGINSGVISPHVLTHPFTHMLSPDRELTALVEADGGEFSGPVINRRMITKVSA